MLHRLAIVAAWRLAIWLYPPEIEMPPGGVGFLQTELERMGPVSTLEKKSAPMIGIGIGIGIGLLATVPYLGVLDAGDVKKLNFLTNTAFGWLEPFVDTPWEAVLVPYWTGFVYHIFPGR